MSARSLLAVPASWRRSRDLSVFSVVLSLFTSLSVLHLCWSCSCPDCLCTCTVLDCETRSAWHAYWKHTATNLSPWYVSCGPLCLCWVSSLILFSLPVGQVRVGLLVLESLAALVPLGVASYSTPLRRAFVSIVPHFLMDSLSGWSVPCFLMDSLSGWSVPCFLMDSLSGWSVPCFLMDSLSGWCFVRLDLHCSLGADGFSLSLQDCCGGCLQEPFSCLLVSPSCCCNNTCLVCKATSSTSST